MNTHTFQLPPLQLPVVPQRGLKRKQMDVVDDNETAALTEQPSLPTCSSFSATVRCWKQHVLTEWIEDDGALLHLYCQRLHVARKNRQTVMIISDTYSSMLTCDLSPTIEKYRHQEERLIAIIDRQMRKIETFKRQLDALL